MKKQYLNKKIKKKLLQLIFINCLYLTSCNSFPYNGDINDATVYHWENEYVTMKQFIQDHKFCLGSKRIHIGSQTQNIFNNMKPKTIPKWNSLWATFESNDYKEAAQRTAFSIPNDSHNSINSYKKCMEKLNYYLTYKR